jgi:hypothetical protein
MCPTTTGVSIANTGGEAEAEANEQHAGQAQNTSLGQEIKDQFWRFIEGTGGNVSGHETPTPASGFMTVSTGLSFHCGLFLSLEQEGAKVISSIGKDAKLSKVC